MAVNDLTINQASTIVNELMAQANIGGAVDIVDTGSFVTAGQKLLKCGYDVVLNAISQVLTRTVFSVRPYERKFGGIQMTEQQFGNVTRKLSIADSSFEDGEFDLPTDGQSVDHYKIKRANVLQMNFYGANNFELQSPTIFRNQLDIAFSSPEELIRFWAMITQNANDMIEQAHENLARATVTNFIGAKIAADNAGIESGSVIHLLTEYNTETGEAFTQQDIKKPANYAAFMQWAYARISAISSKMTERSRKYHTNVTGKEISRHTPMDKQKVYLYAPEMYGLDARVLADKYHDNFLKYADHENVNYWQNIDDPAKINVTPVYLKADGTLEHDTDTAIEQDNIFGVIFDEEALGYTVMDKWIGVTPLNAKGGYTNIFYHFTDRYFNDFTENGTILLMD